MKHVEKMMKQMMAVEEVKQQKMGGKTVGRTTYAPMDKDVAMEVIEQMLIQKGLTFQIAEWNENECDVPHNQGFNVRAAVAACTKVWENLRTYKAKHLSSYNHVYKTIFATYDGKWWFNKTLPMPDLRWQIGVLENLYRELADEDEEAEASTYAAKPTEEPKKGCMTVVKADKAVDSSHRVAPDHPDALTNLVHFDDDYEAERTSDVYAEFGAVQEHATVGARSRDWWTSEQ